MELDTFRAILGKLHSASDVCSFCQSFKNAHKNCKTLFDTTGNNPISAVSLQQLCSIGTLESKLHELVVKYLGLPQPWQASYRNLWNYLTADIQRESGENVKDYEVWTRANLVEEATNFFSGVLDEAATSMEYFYDDPVLTNKMREIPSFHLQTLSEIKRAVDKLLELPSTYSFKVKLMEMFFHKYHNRLTLVGFHTPLGAVGTITRNRNVNSENEPEYTKWVQGIMRAWDF
ncbi:hypothetical protein BKA69DRAFT_1125113 [Paraphysoderma sedebokerense]|nr:hypothetical protein BKA69DRAFT_1125113 [Paraphysoderma sedebokerense]